MEISQCNIIMIIALILQYTSSELLELNSVGPISISLSPTRHFTKKCKKDDFRFFLDKNTEKKEKVISKEFEYNRNNNITEIVSLMNLKEDYLTEDGTKRNLAYQTSLDMYSYVSNYLDGIFRQGDLLAILNKGQKVFVTNKLSEYKVDTGQNIHIILTNLNSQYGTDLYRPVSIFQNENLLSSGKDYYITYETSYQKVHSYNYYSNLQGNADNYKAGCNYTSRNLDLNTTIYTNIKYKSIKKFRVINFAFNPKENGIYLMIFKNNSFEYYNFDKYINLNGISDAYTNSEISENYNTNVSYNTTKNEINNDVLDETSDDSSTVVSNSDSPMNEVSETESTVNTQEDITSSTVVENDSVNNADTSVTSESTAEPVDSPDETTKNSEILNNRLLQETPSTEDTNVTGETSVTQVESEVNTTDNASTETTENASTETETTETVVDTSTTENTSSDVSEVTDNDNTEEQENTDTNTNQEKNILDLTGIPMTQGVAFDNIFIIDQPYQKRNFACFYEQKSTLMLIYEIVTNEKGFLSVAKFFTEIYLKKLITEDKVGLLNKSNYEILRIVNFNQVDETQEQEEKFEYDNGFNVTKVGMYGNYLIIGSLQGLYILQKKSTKIANQFELIRNITQLRLNDYYVNYNMEVLTFEVGMSNLFVLVKNFGIIEINLNSFGFNTFQLFHPHVMQMDMVVNPLKLTKYLGISIKNVLNVNEFFIEINIDNESEPLINKIFTAVLKLEKTEFVTNDHYFSYVFSKNSQKMIVIRRGMLNNLPQLSYVVQLEEHLKGLSLTNNLLRQTVSMYNYDTDLNEVGLLIDDKLFLFSNFRIAPDLLVCRFNSEGRYNLTLEKYSEACENSLGYNYAYSYCNFMIYVNFDVIGDSVSDLAIVGIVLGSFFFIIISVLMAICYFRKRIKKDALEKPKPTRQQLYLDNYLPEDKKQKYIREGRIPDTKEQQTSNTNIVKYSIDNNTYNSNPKIKEQPESKVSNLGINK